MGNRKLLKFKISSDGNNVVKYQIDRDEESSDTVGIETTAIPSKNLSDALQKMADHVISIVEFPSTWLKDIKVLGVTCTYTNDVQGLVITALRTLVGSNAPMVINTPHFTRESYNGDDSISDTSILSIQCGMDLDALESLALKYADGGERLQPDLEFAKPELVVADSARR